MLFCIAGKQLDRSTINYEVPGTLTTKIMGVFLALGSIAFAFGDTILPEIQVFLWPYSCAFEPYDSPCFMSTCKHP